MKSGWHRVSEVTDPRWGLWPLRKGETIEVAPSSPNRRDGFSGTFQAAVVDDGGRPQEIDVYGGPSGREMNRTVRPERIERSTLPEQRPKRVNRRGRS